MAELEVVNDELNAHLVQRIQAGEGAAEAELVERFQRGLVVVLRRRCGDPTLAEDLAQETLALVLEKVRRREVNEPERLAGFVHGVAKRLLVAHRRKAARYVELGDRPEDETRGTGGVGLRSEPGPLDDLVRREEALLVRRLLAELAVPRDREVLFRFYLSEEPSDSICRSLGIDSSHFRRVLFRARERLRQLWRERRGGGGWDERRPGDTLPQGAD